MNRRRLDLIRSATPATYARMIQGRHAESTTLLAEGSDLTDPTDGDSTTA